MSRIKVRTPNQIKLSETDKTLVNLMKKVMRDESLYQEDRIKFCDYLHEALDCIRG